MKFQWVRERLLTIAISALLTTAPQWAAAADEFAVEIHQGTATFEMATSVSVISIHGESKALAGRARIRQDGTNLVIEQLDAALPIKSLSTGLSLRDAHMRKYVFTTTDGAVPDLRFIADRVVCPGSADGGRTCGISGDLVIRGTSRPFTLALKVKGDGDSYRAVGGGVVRLSTYGIPPPSQLGVTAMDDVKLRVDFVVKRTVQQIAQGFGR